MKVLWLFPPSKDGFPNISQYRFYKKMPIRATIIYPYLASMGVTMLHEEGFDVKLLDCPTEEKTEKDVLDELTQTDIAVLEARTPNINDVWEWCNKIRETNAKTQIILYGDHVSYLPTETLPHCDYIVTGGFYDIGVKNLCLQLRRGFYQYPIIDSNQFSSLLNYFPFCNRELVDWRKYYESWRERDVFLWNMSQRGCFYDCVFCAWTKTFWNNKVYFRDASNVAEEYQQLYKKYGELEVLDDADCFSIKWGLKLAENMVKRGLDNKAVLWGIQTHPNEINSVEDLRKLKRAGLNLVKLGVESLNNKTLMMIEKKTNFKQIEKAFNLLKIADIMIHANMMVGFPFESKEEAYKSLDLLKKLNPNQAQFSLVIPYPNTKIYDWARSNGFLTVGEKDWRRFDASRPMMRVDGMSAEEVTQLYRDCWRSFYFNPKFVVERFLKNVRHPKRLLKLVKGARAVYFGHMRAVD